MKTSGADTEANDVPERADSGAEADITDPDTDLPEDALPDAADDLADTGEDAICEPACEGKNCGADECGGQCGSCDEGWGCTDQGVCESLMDDPCVADEPTVALQLGPLQLAISSATQQGLSVLRKAVPFNTQLDRVSLRLGGAAEGGGWLLCVFAASGDALKVTSCQAMTVAPGVTEVQSVDFDPPVLVPKQHHVGLVNPAGRLALGVTGNQTGVWWHEVDGIPTNVGAIIQAEAATGTPAWRARFIDTSPCLHGGGCVVVAEEDFSCDCAPGYQGTHCETLADACANPALNTCAEHAACDSNGAEFSCTCNPGYEGDGDTCTDIDECGALPCAKDAICENTDGGHTCTCFDGFVGNGETCTDIDECAGVADNDCGENTFCTNLPGGFACTCKPGYEPTEPGAKSCIDVDECLNPATCGDFADCENTVGSFNCLCFEGYESDGQFCQDVDECKDPDKNDCHDAAMCLNASGSYGCKCYDGYVGDGYECCGAPQAKGETCEDAFSICALPYTDSRLTVVAANNYGAGIKQCNSGVQGAIGGASADLVYSYTPQTDGMVNITLQADFGAAFYLVTDCGPIAACIPDCTVLGSSCLLAKTVDAGKTDSASFSLLKGLTYFLVVDGQGSQANLTGSYTLTVQAAAP